MAACAVKLPLTEPNPTMEHAAAVKATASVRRDIFDIPGSPPDGDVPANIARTYRSLVVQRETLTSLDTIFVDGARGRNEP